MGSQWVRGMFCKASPVLSVKTPPLMQMHNTLIKLRNKVLWKLKENPVYDPEQWFSTKCDFTP